MESRLPAESVMWQLCLLARMCRWCGLGGGLYERLDPLLRLGPKGEMRSVLERELNEESRDREERPLTEDESPVGDASVWMGAVVVRRRFATCVRPASGCEGESLWRHW